MAGKLIDRRGFLGLAGGTLALGGVSALAGCGGGDSPASGGSNGTAPTGGNEGSGTAGETTAANGGGKLTLPAYVGYEGVKPTLPGLDNGTAAFYDTMPAVADRPAFWQGPPPGKGGTFSVLTFMNSTPKAEKDNQWWQAINEAVGVDIKINGAPVGDYPAKFTVTMAGGDLPDAAVLYPVVMPGLGPLLKAKFADLTEHLAGDAVKDYPGLANLPSYCWEGCVYNGMIQAVPIQRLALETGDVVRADLIQGDATPEPKNGDELVAMLKALTDSKKSRWATIYIWGLLYRAAEMMEVPNIWSVDGGKFTRDYEAPAFPDALDVARQAWKSGYVHPDAFQANYSTKANGLLEAGTVGYVTSRYDANFAGKLGLIKDAGGDPATFTPAKWGGGELAKRWVNGGAPYMTAIKQAPPDRVKEILSIMDWFAAPWATKEWTLRNQGVKDVDYTIDADGNTVRTELGKAEVMVPLLYVGSCPQVHYSAKYPEYARLEYEAEKNGMDHAEVLPTLGLESATDQKEGVSLDTKAQNVMSDIIQGRKDVSDWDDAVQAWKSGGGDTIRAEYEKAYAEKNG